jgi:hypothetical protein
VWFPYEVLVLKLRTNFFMKTGKKWILSNAFQV